MQDGIPPDHGSGYQGRPGTPARSGGRPGDGRHATWARGPELRALGAAVRELRARRGFSQEALGFRADLHRNYVGGIERGELNVTFRILLNLSHGLDIRLFHRDLRAQPHGAARHRRGRAGARTNVR